jgi:lauroyl/myristoyl acyltransferase
VRESPTRPPPATTFAVGDPAPETPNAAGREPRSVPGAVGAAGWVDGALLRRLAYLGARHGPRPLIEYSPTFFGVVFAALLSRRRATLRDNQRRVIGRRARWREEVDAVRTFVRYAHCTAESLGIERPEGARARLSLQGEDEVVKWVATGRGVVLITAHTGLWDLAGRALVERTGARVTVVMAPEPDSRARAFHDGLRQRAGVTVLHADHTFAALPLLRELRSGGIVAIQIDREPSGMRSIDTRLGDERFGVPVGPFLLAGLADVPLIPVFARRLGFFSHELRFGVTRRVSHRPAAAELERVAQGVVDELAGFVREHPTDWFPFAPRRER